MTLVELLAGLVILGVLISSVLVARSRYLHQLARANRSLEASSAAEVLLTEWWKDLRHFPRHGDGTVVGGSDLWWSLSERPMVAADLPKLVIVRLELWDTRAPNAMEPLCCVELVMPPKSEDEVPVVVGRQPS